MMTLDEAIEHAELTASNCEGECSEEHRQLAEWLMELQALKAENEQYRELIRILDHDWNIEASWDGLRRFWYVGLNERGVAERDEREAENDRLKRFAKLDENTISALNSCMDDLNAENFKLRDFIELLLSCPRDSDECKECRRLNDLCAVELEAGKLGIEV